MGSRTLALVLASLLPGVEAKTALIIVDAQRCFTNERSPNQPFAACDPTLEVCTRKGSLGVATGASIVPLINQLRIEKGCLFDTIVRTQDYHPAGHVSFSSSYFGDGTPNSGFSSLGGPIPFVGFSVDVHCIKATSHSIDDAQCCFVNTSQTACASIGTAACEAAAARAARDVSNIACSTCKRNPSSCLVMSQALWTDHCLQSGDADFAAGLLTAATDIVIQKGSNKHVDAYSAFMDNAKVHKTALDATLKQHDVDHVYITGIATDYCVSWTAIDAVDLGYKTTIIIDATAPIAIALGVGQTTVDVARAEWIAKGVAELYMSEIMEMPCPSPRTPPPSLPPAGKGAVFFSLTSNFVRREAQYLFHTLVQLICFTLVQFSLFGLVQLVHFVCARMRAYRLVRLSAEAQS